MKLGIEIYFIYSEISLSDELKIELNLHFRIWTQIQLSHILFSTSISTESESWVEQSGLISGLTNLKGKWLHFITTLVPRGLQIKPYLQMFNRILYLAREKTPTDKRAQD